MTYKVAIEFAASSLVIGALLVGCKPTAHMHRPAALSANAASTDRQAAKFNDNAVAAFQKGDLERARGFIEQAVEMSPRDAGYRMSLAEIYLKSGRLSSAETAFSDVLTLNPENDRAALNLALVQIALGKNGAAVNQLDALQESLAAGDLGLAYALAGQPQRAVEMLEPAARAADADGRVRQNLALAYAMTGDWQKARITAAQDVSPAEIGDRMAQWAAFVQPAAPWTQVASLLGVTPVQDAGQPTRLALAPAPTEDFALAALEESELPAAASSVTVDIVDAPVAVPVAVAALAPMAAPVPQTSPEPVPADPKPVKASPTQYAEAAESLFTAPTTKAVPANIRPLNTFNAGRPAKLGRYVVQIGAFSTAGQVERAWNQAQKRYGFAAAKEPVSTTVRTSSNIMLHRLAVASFATPKAAYRFCQSIKTRRGACFVRATAGDAPVRWASRNARKA